MSMPSGTVTFLFTDIEGSTNLWEQHPEEMRAALARHDQLLRLAIEARNGTVVKSTGDGVLAAFARAPDGVSAALALQQATLAEPWPEQTQLRVRAALHVGTAEFRDGDYYGSTLNRAARLLAVGHGGQVLLSLTTCQLVCHNLPAEATLQDMGKHRLKDLLAPEHVWQLLHPTLPSEFQPLKSLDYLPTNLPRQMTSFIGRDREMVEVKHLLSSTPLLTLVGTGGAGKTRLALQAGADVLEGYKDGVWLVELAALSDSGLIAHTMAAAWGLREEAGKPLQQTLQNYLQNKHLLLILDNCEHLLGGCAQIADSLLKGCPYLCILATSREPLGIAGERLWRVPSLLTPAPADLPMKEKNFASVLMEYDACRLFAERAIVQRQDFILTLSNVPVVAHLCQQLDGIPLAIELAAARVRSLSVEEINNKLDNRFRLLTGGSRTAMPRQQTLRALIDWSYDLLKTQEKALLCRLSVFAGGWTLAAAEEVGSADSATGEGIEAWEVLDLLASLVDKSLVLAQPQGETTRYRLLETVRQYAGERLIESGEHLVVRARHAEYFLTLAEEVRPKLLGSEQVQWLEVLEEEHDNLRQALTLYTEDAEGGENGLRLGAALQEFWWTRGPQSEGRERLSALLAHPGGQEPTHARAGALNGAGCLAIMQGDYVSACVLHQESLTIRRELGDKRGIGISLSNLADMAYAQGDYAQARVLYEESLAMFRELGNKRGIAYSLRGLGNVAVEEEDYVSAHVLHQESLTIRRELGDNRGIAACLNYLGDLAHAQGDYVQAHVLHQESLTIRRELGDERGIAYSLNNLGLVAYEQGDYAQARVLHTESLAMLRELGDSQGITCGLEAFASLAVNEAREEHGVRLWGAAAALRETIGTPLRPNERKKWERAVTAVRKALGEDVFAAAWAQGRAMTMEQAIDYVLNLNF